MGRLKCRDNSGGANSNQEKIEGIGKRMKKKNGKKIGYSKKRRWCEENVG